MSTQRFYDFLYEELGNAKGAYLNINQRGEEWTKMRLENGGDYLGASCVADFLGLGYANMTAPRLIKTYRDHIPTIDESAPAMQWGAEHENDALSDYYELYLSNTYGEMKESVREDVMIIHPGTFIGEFSEANNSILYMASPDGFLVDLVSQRVRMVEAKCPYYRNSRLIHIWNGVPWRYMIQCQLQMHLAMFNEIDFVVWLPINNQFRTNRTKILTIKNDPIIIEKVTSSIFEPYKAIIESVGVCKRGYLLDIKKQFLQELREHYVIHKIENPNAHIEIY